MLKWFAKLSAFEGAMHNDTYFFANCMNYKLPIIPRIYGVKGIY